MVRNQNPGSFASMAEGTLDEVVQQLQQLVAAHHLLRAALAGHAGSAQSEAVQEFMLMERRTEQALDALLPATDQLAQAVRSSLDNAHLLLAQHPPLETSPREVLSYAHKLRYTTFASLGVLPGQPPAPQVWDMRASKLYALQAAAAAAEEAATRVPAAVEAKRQAPEAPPAQLQPPVSLPPMPADWQPGMPVPLDLDLLKIPDGWQPGDPIPGLPPLPAAGPIEQQLPAAAAAAPPAAAPAAVRELHMDFELNADLDDFEAEEVQEISEEEESDDD